MPKLLTKKSFMIATCLMLAACEEPGMGAPTGEAPQQAAFVDGDATAIAADIALGVNDIAGQNLGGGGNFRSARSEGDKLFLELELPLAASGVSDSERRRGASFVRDNLRRSNCRTPSLSALLDAGGEIEVGVYGRDNRIIDTFTYSRPCT